MPITATLGCPRDLGGSYCRHFDCYAWVLGLTSGQAQALPAQNTDAVEEPSVSMDKPFALFRLAGSSVENGSCRRAGRPRPYIFIRHGAPVGMATPWRKAFFGHDTEDSGRLPGFRPAKQACPCQPCIRLPNALRLAPSGPGRAPIQAGCARGQKPAAAGPTRRGGSRGQRPR